MVAKRKTVDCLWLSFPFLLLGKELPAPPFMSACAWLDFLTKADDLVGIRNNIACSCKGFIIGQGEGCAIAFFIFSVGLRCMPNIKQLATTILQKQLFWQDYVSFIQLPMLMFALVLMRLLVPASLKLTLTSLLSDTTTNFGVRKRTCIRWVMFLVSDFLEHIKRNLAKKISL